MWFLSPDQTLPDTYIVCDIVALKKIFVELMAITLSLTPSGFVLSALQAFAHFIVKVI